jgi:hypothetical protein
MLLKALQKGARSFGLLHFVTEPSDVRPAGGLFFWRPGLLGGCDGRKADHCRRQDYSAKHEHRGFFAGVRITGKTGWTFLTRRAPLRPVAWGPDRVQAPAMPD